MSTLPVFTTDQFNAESVGFAFALIIGDDVDAFVDALWRATFRDPAEPRSIIADFRSGGDCSILATAEVVDGQNVATFSFAAPTGTFRGRAGTLRAELMRLDGVSEKNVAIVEIGLDQSSTYPFGSDP